MSKLSYTRHSISQHDAEGLLRLLGSGGPLTQGPMVEAFETALCALTGAPYAVVVNSGTAALHLAYGILYPPGTRITMPAISFVATANAALYCGLRPEWKECSPQTGLAMEDCDVGVELGGQPTGHRHTVVDACHSVRYVESALATILSFHPAKHICTGEGGALLTGDKMIADRARLLRTHGRDGSMVALGYNYRMADLNAQLGVTQSVGVMERIAKRKTLAAQYDTLLGGFDVVPHHADSHRHLYQIRLKDRDRVQAALKAQEIETAIHYTPIPDQPYYQARGLCPDIGLGWARDYASQTLSLPLFPQMTTQDVERVVDALKESL